VKCVAVVALLAIVAAAWWWHGAREPAKPTAASTPPAKDESISLPVATVLRVRPSTTPVAPPSAPQSALAESSPLKQFRDGVDFASLYRSLDGDRSAEALYLRAEIYARCVRHATQTDRASANDRATLVAALARDPDAAQRVDAFDRMQRDPCQGVDLGKFDRQAFTAMLDAAAAAGDARAKAWQLAARVETAYYGAQRVDRASTGYPLTREDFEQARQLLATGDPSVIADLQGLLSSSLEHGTVQLDGRPIDHAAMHSALTLLACDAGANCGPDAPSLLRDCAFRGRCAAGTVSESMFYYETSPAQAQIIDRYHRELLAMMNAHDFSALTLADVDHVPGFSMTFGGRRVIWDPPVADVPPGKSKSRMPTLPADSKSGSPEIRVTLH